MLPLSADGTLITSDVAVACLKSYAGGYELGTLGSTGLICEEISKMKMPQKLPDGSS